MELIELAERARRRLHDWGFLIVPAILSLLIAPFRARASGGNNDR